MSKISRQATPKGENDNLNGNHEVELRGVSFQLILILQ